MRAQVKTNVAHAAHSFRKAFAQGLARVEAKLANPEASTAALLAELDLDDDGSKQSMHHARF